MHFSKLNSVILVSLVCLFISCKPNTENETARFQSNIEALGLLSHTYPIYSNFISEEVEGIKEKWNDVLVISNTEEKAKAMANVNKSMTTDGISGGLYSIDKKYNQLVERKNRIDSKKVRAKNSSSIEKHLRTYDYYMEWVNKDLSRELLTDDSEFFAKSRIKSAKSYLEKASDGLNKAEDFLNANKPKIAKKKNPSKNRKAKSKSSKK